MKHLKRIMGAMALIAAVSCTKDQRAETGQVSFDLQSDYDITEQTRSNVSDYATLPSKNDFDLTVTGTSKSFAWTGKFSEWDNTLKIPAGSYIATATYGSLEDEGLAKPFFTGEKSFTVNGGETANESIETKLGNTIVKISCSTYFSSYFDDCVFTISRDATVIATMNVGSDDAVFVDGYKLTISGASSKGDFSKDFTNLDEATAYTMYFDVTNVGGINKITVTFDDSVETVDLGNFDLNE